MANEAVIVELVRNLHPVRRTCADTPLIEKGTLLKLSDPNTVAASSAVDVWGGVAAAEKVASDGALSIACHLSGAFDLTTHTAAAISIGEQVTLSGTNLIRAATEAEVQLGKYIGTAEEVAAAGTQEVIRVRLRGY